jgi:hypothetical protein
MKLKNSVFIENVYLTDLTFEMNFLEMTTF